MSISSVPFCQLLGCKPEWFAKRLQRARLAALAGEDTEAWHTLPVENLGKSPTFDAADAVRVAVAMEFERLGGTFSAGARLAVEAEAASVLTHTGPGDLFAVAMTLPDGTSMHRCAGLDFVRRIGAEAPARCIITVNISAILRRLQADARRLGLDTALGWHSPHEEAA